MSTAWAQERFALVVGNDILSGTAPLVTPAKDAFDVSAAMIGLGFNVRRLRNAGQEDLWATMGSIAKPDGPVLFYYAGPVFAADGKTYLGPADAGAVDVADTGTRAVALDDIIAALGTVTQQEIVVILEVCHAPGEAPPPGAGRIAPPDPDRGGVFYGFSQAPGTVCDPGDPLRPRITDALLAGLKRSNLAIADMFAPTGNASDAGPWTQDRLTAAFVPNRPAIVTPVTSRPAEGSPSDGTAIVVAAPPQAGETIVVTAPIRPIVFAPPPAPAASQTPQFGTSSPAGVIVFAASAPMRTEFSTQIDTGLPEPSIIVGRIRPTPASFPTVDLGMEPEESALTGQELLFSGPEARARLRQDNPELFLTLLENGMFDPPPDQLVRAIQTDLTRMNCNTSGVDGRWGRGSRRAVTRFYAEIGEPVPSADPTMEIYRKILLRDDVACAPVRATTTRRQPAQNAAPRRAATPAAPAPATGRRIINPSIIGANR